MRDIDIGVIRGIVGSWAKEVKDVRNIALASASQEEADLFREIFPNANFEFINRATWDFTQSTDQNYDLVWCLSVFMCSSDPELWLKNILARTRYLWILDHIEAWRCGPDGPERATFDSDMMRYHVPGERAALPEAFDLGTYLGDRIKEQYVYPVPGPKGENRSFVMWIEP